MRLVTKQELATIGTDPIPTEPYHSQAFFDLERERVFRRAWICAGREEEVAEPGSYLVKDIEICGVSILIARGNDGVLRAFHNVCSHRGVKLVWDQNGAESRFACRFHGWKYGLDGELLHAPDEKNFFDLDYAACALTPASVDTCARFVFVHVDAVPPQTLLEYLGAMAPKLEDFPFAQWTSFCQFECEMDVNWKFVVDAFQETYHLGFTHSLSVADRSIAHANPFGHALAYEFHGPHRMMEIWGNTRHKPALAEGALVQQLATLPEEVVLRPKPGQKQARPSDWQMDVHVLFPNFMVDATAVFCLTQEAVPLAVDRTSVLY